MSKTKPIQISILNEEYNVTCGEGEEDALRRSARFLDKRMKEIRDAGKVFSSQQIAVMAALNISHEFLMLQEKELVDQDKLSRKYKAMRQRVEIALTEANQLDL